MTKTRKAELETIQRELNDRALQLLRSPHLLCLYLDATERCGLVGEHRNALVVGIVGVSRIMKNPINLLVKARSSAGKNHLVDCALRTFPEDAIRDLTSTSKLAWNYAADYFRHRILYLRERNRESGAIHPARLLISEGRLVRTVTVNDHGVWRTKTFVAEGPIASISTTTKNQLEIDDETRHISIWVDESRDQTRRVLLAQAREPNPLSTDELQVWRRAHSLLETRVGANVVLPGWFERVAERVYDGNVRSRRYFPAHTTACKTIAVLRSYQEDKDIRFGKDGVIEVDFVDYAIATLIFEPIFVQSIHRGDDEALHTRAVVDQISKRTGKGVSAEQLAEELDISKDKAYERLRSAAEQEVIRRANKPEQANRKRFLPSRLPRFAPHPDKIFREIKRTGDFYRFVHPLNGEWIEGHR